MPLRQAPRQTAALPTRRPLLGLVAIMLVVRTAAAFSHSAVLASFQAPTRLSSRFRNTRVVLSTSADSSSSSLPTTPPPPVPNFCADCGKPDMELVIPDGDERLRAVCPHCGRIEYSNPKIVVACVVTVKSGGEAQQQEPPTQTLLAKRAIEPRKGTWGIPQGFMEHGETTRQAAAREVVEETGVVVDPAQLELRAVYNVPGTVQLLYECVLMETDDNATPTTTSVMQQQIDAFLNDPETKHKESEQVLLVSDDELATKELCFPTVQWALDHCREQAQSTTNGNRIQQMTKFYDAETDTWGQYEEEVA